MNLSKDYMYKYPIKTTLYYPVAIPVKNTLLFWIYITFLHFLPAFIKDAYDYFTGNKPKYPKIINYLSIIIINDFLVFLELSKCIQNYTHIYN